MSDHHPPPQPQTPVATSQTDPLKELDATMERMRKVADGSIEAPALTRRDASAALAVCDGISQAPDLWDGTLEDLAGYLRMMGALLKGVLQIKEVMPTMNNKPAPPVFDVFVSETLAPGRQHKNSGVVIFDVFVAGDPKRAGTDSSLEAEPVIQSARQQFESYDSEIRDVVSAMSVLHMVLLNDGKRDCGDVSLHMFKDIIDKIRYDATELARLKLEASGVYGISSGDEDVEEEENLLDCRKIISLQKSLQDKLGVTRDQLDLQGLRIFCHWRIGAAVLGIDNYFREEENFLFEAESGGIVALEFCSMERPEFLPPYYDRALYMASKPREWEPNDALGVALRGLKAAQAAAVGLCGDQRPLASAPWAQLRLQWVATKAMLAGNLEDENDTYYFVAAQLQPQVEATEKLLERLRPWLGDVAAFKKIDKEVKGWRRKYITDKDVNEPQKPVAINCVMSQWAVRDGDKTCASCGTSPQKLKVCSACKQVWYCNAVCQKAGWKAHKKTCIASRKNA